MMGWGKRNTYLLTAVESKGVDALVPGPLPPSTHPLPIRTYFRKTNRAALYLFREEFGDRRAPYDEEFMGITHFFVLYEPAD